MQFVLSGKRMNSVIKVNQALHGYANGHQLIASSVDLSADDKRLMDELSMFTLYNSEMSQREIILKLTLYSGYVTLTIYISGKQFFNHSVI